MATTVLSGTAAIEDNYMISSSGNTNCGGRTEREIGYSVGIRFRGLNRIIGSIPDGQITGVRYFEYVKYLAGSGKIDLYQIKSANDWVEGTSAGGTQTGSSCYAYAKYNTQSWAGTSGCGASGTDYVADASPPGSTILSAGWNQFDCRTEWAEDWKSGSGEGNQGWFTRANLENGSLLIRTHSTEYGTGLQPYMEIDAIDWSVRLMMVMS